MTLMGGPEGCTGCSRMSVVDVTGRTSSSGLVPTFQRFQYLQGCSLRSQSSLWHSKEPSGTFRYLWPVRGLSSHHSIIPCWMWYPKYFQPKIRFWNLTFKVWYTSGFNSGPVLAQHSWLLSIHCPPGSQENSAWTIAWRFTEKEPSCYQGWVWISVWWRSPETMRNVGVAWRP